MQMSDQLAHVYLAENVHIVCKFVWIKCFVKYTACEAGETNTCTCIFDVYINVNGIYGTERYEYEFHKFLLFCLWCLYIV